MTIQDVLNRLAFYNLLENLDLDSIEVVVYFFLELSTDKLLLHLPCLKLL